MLFMVDCTGLVTICHKCTDVYLRVYAETSIWHQTFFFFCFHSMASDSRRSPQPTLSSLLPRRATSSTVRFLTFNVNGCKTLFNYFPWNSLQNNFNSLLNSFQSDIISLQELKISPGNISSVNLGHLPNYKSFVSLPKSKKGYSGVGLFVRIPDADDDNIIKNHLQVLKAEEGITGCLKIDNKCFKDLPPDIAIGGYVDIPDDLGIKLDNEGRAVIVELQNNLVVFSLYCPANSMQTPEGEEFRLNFLSVLFERCKNLIAMGKQVVVMGDINVSLDLIDHADTINEWKKRGKVFFNPERDFELDNYEQCVEFKSSTPARELLNSYCKPSIYSTSPLLQNQVFFDTTRVTQKRRMAMYTVWNTMTSSRQSNYGSRIDYILTNSSALKNSVNKADILPQINGSDHCPVFTDFDFGLLGNNIVFVDPPKKIQVEAKHMFKLVKHGDISDMFMRKRSNNSVTKSPPPKAQPTSGMVYKRRKKPQDNTQTSIGDFFMKNSLTSVPEPTLKLAKEPKKPLSISSISELMYGKPPECHHGKPCDLKTSHTLKTKGKKFWCCSAAGRNPDVTTSIDDQTSCNYFEWVNKKPESEL